MWDRNHPVFWSLSVGRIFGTEIRLSWTLPLFAVLCWALLGWQLGSAYCAILFLSVLLHEYGHVAGARSTGGMADEIILTPIGGMTTTQPGTGFLAQVLTPAAGPAVNLLLCVLFFPGLYAPGMIWPALDLSTLPIAALHADRLVTELLILMFAANWFLLAINLLPVFPFDGGQIAHAVLARRLPPDLVFRGMMWVGMVTAVALMVGGLLAKWPALIILGAIVLVFNILQSMQGRIAEFPDDSFMGYDFSQGYTSLERSSGHVSEKEPRVSRWQRWKQEREARRREQEREKQLQDELQLDRLLAKVHVQGIDSLTRAERNILQRVSSEYRERSKRQSS